MRWITRHGILIDRVACPWLIKRFIDPNAEFFFVRNEDIQAETSRLGAIPFDVHDEDVELTHHGSDCSFDAFLKKYHVVGPAFERLALIVRGADTARLDLAPQCAGLLAISQGLRRVATSDEQMLALASPIYEALYAWALNEGRTQELHNWTYG